MVRWTRAILSIEIKILLLSSLGVWLDCTGEVSYGLKSRIYMSYLSSLLGWIIKICIYNSQHRKVFVQLVKKYVQVSVLMSMMMALDE